MNEENHSPAGAQSLWFYADASNQPVGPLPMFELQRLAAAGVIQPGTQVIENGASEWQAFLEVAPRPVPPPPFPEITPTHAPRRWPTILALVFLYPVGLVLLWRNKLFTKRTKVLVAVIVTPIFIGTVTSNQPKARTGTSAAIERSITAGDGSVAYKVASLDAGKVLPKDAPQTGAYQKLIAEIAEQKSITEQQVADMTWATVKKAREMGVDCDCLSLLLGAHKVCMADNALSAQKGADAYASILAGIVVLMKADTDAPTPKSKDSATTAKELIIPEGTPLYADEETLRTMKSESEKQGEAGTEALKRLSKEGKIWGAEGNIVVRVVRQGGPMGAIQVEAKDGNRLKTSRFWVIGDKFPTANSARATQMQKNTRRASEFVQVFDGRNAMFLNGADIGNLAEMVQAIYDGKVSAKTASQYAFKRDALEGKFTNVAGQYLIYEVDASGRRHLEFAMRRDADFEKEKAKTYGSVQDFYDDLRGAEFHSDSPLTQAGAMIVGMEQFTTSVGLVKVVPIVESVNIAP